MASRQKKTEVPVASTTAASRYAVLETLRSSYIRRAEDCASLTIPALFPKNGDLAADIEPPYQSVGARGVNNLAAKLLLALFPPGGAFFKLALDDMVVKDLAQNAESEDARSEFEEALGSIERSVMNRFEQAGARSTLFTAIKHLIVTGNGLVEVLKRGKLKFHNLRNYVVSRDLEGNLLEIVVRERLARASLPAAILAVLPKPETTEGQPQKEESPEVDIFTHVELKGSRWSVYQEVEGVLAPGSRGSYPLDRLPFLPLRFIAIDGEDYGRSYAEEYQGDLATCDSLTGSVVDFAAVAARIVFLVDQGGVTSPKKLQDAPNGAFVNGRKDDISTLQLEKMSDFSVANSVKEETRVRLEQAFLLASSIQRNAERVTAEEVRVMAGELEQTLGGIYSVLAQELQLPLVSVYMGQMQREGKLPSLPKDTVSPQIVTGLEGLGRNTDLGRLQNLVGDLAQAVGPENIGRYLNVGSYLKRVATALGIDATGLIRSEEEVQAQLANEQQQAIAERMAPNVVNAASAATDPTATAPT